jgi:hypothetical protein
MPDSTMVARHFLDSLNCAAICDAPFRHWLLDSILPDATCRAIDALSVTPRVIGDTQGKRETHNSARLFFGRAQQAREAVCRHLAAALQDRTVVQRLQALCNVTLAGGFLRIEYCLDTDGFWLEPHTDIGAKLFTMLIYLSDDPGSAGWGTDLLDAAGTLVLTTPYRRDSGLIFIPGADTWHGFHRRRITGVRRSLIVNYVKPEWRSRHELAFPDQPVSA